MTIAVVVLLFVLIATGMPLAFALGVVGMLGVWLFGGFDPMMAFLTTTPFTSASNYELMTIPMFVLMAVMTEVVRASECQESGLPRSASSILNVN